MNLTQLKYFQAVCEYGNVTKAAEILHVSQPSISSSIKALEDEFGVFLFKRQYRGMSLTTEGQKLLSLSRNVIGSADLLTDIMMDLGRKRHTLRLGVPPMIGSLVLPVLFRDFLTSHPDISIEIVEDGSPSLRQKLSEELVDMALVPQTDVIDPAYRSVPVSTLEFGCVTSKAHPFTYIKNIPIKMLDGEKIVMFPSGFHHSSILYKRFAEADVHPRVILKIAQIYSICEMVRNDLAVGFLFKDLVRHFDDIVFVPLEEPVYVNIALTWKKDAYRFSDMDALIRYAERGKLTVE